MRRKKVARGKSRKVFRKTSGFHRKNAHKRSSSYRGGIRL